MDEIEDLQNEIRELKKENEMFDNQIPISKQIVFKGKRSIKSQIRCKDIFITFGEKKLARYT